MSAHLDHITTVAGGQSLACVLLNHQDGETDLAVEPLDGAEDLLGDDRSEAGRRLIHQHESRLPHQGSTNLEHSLLTARHRAGLLLAPLGESGEEIVDVFDPFLNLRFVSGQIHPEFKILVDGHLGKHTAKLRDDGDSGGLECLFRWDIGDLAAVAKDSARSNRDDAVDRLEHGGFSGTVWSDYAHDLATVDLERHAFENVLPGVVAGVDVLDLE